MLNLQTKNANVKIKSPFWISFAIFWFAFNYDIIFHLCGNYEAIEKIGKYYCEDDKAIITPAGCVVTTVGVYSPDYIDNIRSRFLNPLYFTYLAICFRLAADINDALYSSLQRKIKKFCFKKSLKKK